MRRQFECMRCSGGGNSPGETRSPQPVGSSRGSCEELAELFKPPETTAVAGLKCESGGELPRSETHVLRRSVADFENRIAFR